MVPSVSPWRTISHKPFAPHEGEQRLEHARGQLDVRRKIGKPQLPAHVKDLRQQLDQEGEVEAGVFDSLRACSAAASLCSSTATG